MRCGWGLWIVVAGGLSGLAGCGSEPAEAETARTAVYVCTETGEAFVGRVQAVPVSHPDNGRRTLMPGLYNPKTGSWQPSPPIELLGGNPGAIVNRESDHALTPNGPTDDLRRLPQQGE